MTDAGLHAANAARAGRLACLCPDDLAPDDLALHPAASAARAGAAFGLSVLAQVLTISVLPLAGAMIAPEPARAGWPFAAMLLGSVAATMPAAILRDAFGRRAAFALGAGIGAAGGVAAAYAVALDLFGLLLVAAAWLGVAQGFGLAYRHEALALPAGWRETGAPLIFGAGAVAGLIAPTLVGIAERAAAPLPFAGTLATAAITQIAVLALAVAPFRHASARQNVATGGLPWSGLAWPTLVAGLAWLAMTHAMANAPGMLVGCGVSTAGVAGLIAWHVIAMYAPALGLPLLPGRFRGAPLAMAGLVLVTAGSAALALASAPGSIAVALAATGAGWCLATVGAAAMIHAGGPGRLQLAAHDAALVAAALAGALV